MIKLNLVKKINVNNFLNTVELSFDNKIFYFNFITGINYFLYYNKSSNEINKSKVFIENLKKELIAEIKITKENSFILKEFK